jgi:hypothetical protein
MAPDRDPLSAGMIAGLGGSGEVAIRIIAGRDRAGQSEAHCPQGMIGTVDSELCGEPSMILSLIAR